MYTAEAQKKREASFSEEGHLPFCPPKPQWIPSLYPTIDQVNFPIGIGMEHEWSKKKWRWMYRMPSADSFPNKDRIISFYHLCYRI